ncbi:unnamed protein product [Mycena citricolor]|uniref:ubiquitinyl hydrolase 1 n=1 Tax=Mycena citricolor TaxID=2018698 RepID=A0AAD2HSW6_9AGAR|nr:unnamed protein product [Mycena citricolor]
MSESPAFESLIYHERQEPGSMLCAQHALNSLLQGNYFTAPDLSEIALGLDELEGGMREEGTAARQHQYEHGRFGFLFGASSRERAESLGTGVLIRWRSEEMRPYQDHPEEQLAFVLNSEQHWYTFRRFASHWYNLNSFVAKPEWVSPLYLGALLQQAERDGYSIFVVTSTDPNTGLPRTEADDIAFTLGESSSSGRPGPSGRSAEDEDLELQAALQASMADEAGVPDDRSADPVAASVARNKMLLDRMKAEQEYARGQMLQDEVAGMSRRDDTEDETEEQMIRRAIEESERYAEMAQGDDGNAVAPSASHFGEDGYYDDDDAELQAALRASLEATPEGWSLPEHLQDQPEVPTAPALSHVELPVETEDAPAQEEVSVEEMRRRRLARFGS